MKKELATALALLAAVCSFSPLRMAGAGRISPVGQERKDNPAISPEKARRCVADGRISYQDFGARGDGKTDDLPAIVATHAFANAHGLKVKAADNAVYYLGGRNDGQHDFGYVCYMPRRITLENLLIVDPRTRSYRGPALFGNFNSAMKSREYVEPYPYVRTEEVILKNVSTRSGLPLRTSDNALMFKDVKITESSLPNPTS